MQGTKNLIYQKPAGVSAHLINGQELEVVESSKHLSVTVTSNLSSIIQSTYLFLYANQTQQKLLSSWDVDKHALQTNRCKIVFTTVKNILRIINYVKCTRYSWFYNIIMLVGILNSNWNLHTFKLVNQSDPAEGKFAFKFGKPLCCFWLIRKIIPEQCTTILKMLDQFQDSWDYSWC